MSKALDDLSKNLARGMSRRRALLLFGGSIMAVFLGDRAAGTVILQPDALQELIEKTSKNDFCIPSIQNPVAGYADQRISHCRFRVPENQPATIH